MNIYISVVLNSADFDYLLSKGNSNAPINRSSLLLKFDPLLGVAVPLNQFFVNEGQEQYPLKEGEQTQPQQQQLLQPLHINSNFGTKNLKLNVPQLSPTVEESDHDLSQPEISSHPNSTIKDNINHTADQHSDSNDPTGDTSLPQTETLLNCTVNLTTQTENPLNSTITTSTKKFPVVSEAVANKEVVSVSKVDEQQQFVKLIKN